MTFTGAMYENRVNSAEDGLPKLNKPRLIAIDTADGRPDRGLVPSPRTVLRAHDPRRSPTRGAASRSGGRCRPWHEPSDDWFHKYVVSQVTEADLLTGGSSVVNRYEYVGDAAWAWDDNPLVEKAKRSWSDWRGYEKVIVRTGDQAQDPGVPLLKTQAQFFRGMHGDRLNRDGGIKEPFSRGLHGDVVTPDSDELAGFQRETITYLGDTAQEVGRRRSAPPRAVTPAPRRVLDTTLKSYQVENVRDVIRTKLAAGGYSLGPHRPHL